MTEIPSALLEPAPAPPPSAKEPPGSPPDTPFAAMLDDHQARTAVAEGHSRGDEQSDSDTDAKPAKPASTDAVSLAALLGGVPLALDARVVVAPAVAAAGSAEPGPSGGRVLSPGETFREQARGIVLTRATRPIGVPADATALPLRPPVPGAESAPAGAATASSPSLPIGLGAAGAEGRGAGLGAAPAVPAVARATRLADVLQGATARAGAVSADASATPAPATAAGVAAHAPGAAAGERPATAATAPAAPAPVAPATAPAAPSASAPDDMPAIPARAVGLDHAVETVRLALRASAERGVSHARISLTPRELGSIEVHLRQTADGLVARVVAQHAGAAQQLQQAGAELRRSLEQQGLNVLRLDIGASGDETAGRRGAAFDNAAAFGDERRGSRGTGADPLAALDGLGDADTAETATTLQLPNGALVDVLA